MSKNFHETGKTRNQANNDKEIVVAEGSTPPEEFDNAGAIDTPEQAQARQKQQDGADWLSMSRDAHSVAEDYFESSIRRNVERNIAHHSGRHAAGSKYYSDAYKFRAKGFRPKTRSVLRRSEAKGAIAMFSTNDAVSVTAENKANPSQVASAEINQELLSYRLDNTINWFQTVMGAYQDANVSGVVISHQCWDFEEAVEEEVLRGADGQTVFDNETRKDAIGVRRTIIKDTPRVELRPIENIKFSPSADWDDPLGTSPYLIDEIPMEIGEIKQKALSNGKSSIPWYDLDDVQLRAGGTTDHNAVRAQRESGRQDSKDQSHSTNDFDTVWVHRNIIRKNGVDYIFYTLGTLHLLSDPIPLREEYPHLAPGQRPYTLGVSIIESHKIYPESLAGIFANLQQESNDLRNQRFDNVLLAMNGRYFAKRAANIDYQNLTRSIPGGVTEVDHMEDIKSDRPQDVTSSSYQEQDRLNLDFDEVAGSFSNSSVASNRRLNETVGGMEMMTSDSDDITEYQLRTFVVTWAQPVLKQLVQLEQYYETDEAVLQLVADKLDLWSRYGVSQLTDRILKGNMNVKVNVGFGATNPKQRVEKLTTGLNTVLNFVPSMATRMDGNEVADEIFGALGYDSAARFFPELDEENMPEQQEDPKVTIEKMRQEGKQLELQHKESMQMNKHEHEVAQNGIKAQIQNMGIQLNHKVALMKQQGVDAKLIEDMKKEFGLLVMKLKSTERLVNQKASADQLPKPPIEPAGQAEAGMSYTQ